MATWLSHLRLAENILKFGFDLPIEPFLIGSIAPDSGLPLKGGGFDPPKTVTHWLDAFGMQPEAFYDAYLRQPDLSPERRAFLLGYYLHLVTDIDWICNVVRPTIHFHPQRPAEFHPERTTEFFLDPRILHSARDDIFAHDAAYIRANPDGIQAVFQTIDSSPDYLDYLPAGYLTQAIRRVQQHYADAQRITDSAAHQPVYLAIAPLNAWIDCTTGTLIELLRGRDVPLPTVHPLWGTYIQPYA